MNDEICHWCPFLRTCTVYKECPHQSRTEQPLTLFDEETT